MAKPRYDLTGQKFGRLTALKRIDNYINSSGKCVAKWECVCDCGKITYVATSALISGGTTSCGCLHKEVVSEIMSNLMKKSNQYEVMGDYMIGYDARNNSFFIDNDDYERVSEFYWGQDSNGYYTNRTNNDCLYLHRFIMNCPNGMVVDHINGNPSDNRKQNLRIVTQHQNAMNARLNINNTSGTTGVSWDKENNKWIAAIGVNNKTIKLGRFINIEDAIKARKEAEDKYFGEYKRTYVDIDEGEK